MKATTMAERVSTGAERIPRIVSQWSTSTEIKRRGDPDSKAAQLGRARAALVAVDARLNGNKKLLYANRDVSHAMHSSSCKCRNRACSECRCVTQLRSCGVNCECRGFCCNSVLHTPKLCLRGGALGEELYTKADLPRGKLAFVVCGRVMAVTDYRQYNKSANRNIVGLHHYGFFVTWMGRVKYVVDPFEDMTGAVNHSCEPSVVVEACWANGKIFAVGRTRRNIMAKEALTVDYKWEGSANPKEFAEICQCRETVCRGFIAERGSKLLEVSTLHYEGEIARLQQQHVEAEAALQGRYEALASKEQTGNLDDVAELEIELIQRENKNVKLKVFVEEMVAAVTRSRASLADASTATMYVVEIPQANKIQASPLRKLMRRIHSLFSRKQVLKEAAEEEEELHAEIMISSATNPCFAPGSQHDFEEKREARAVMPRSCPSSLREGTPSTARLCEQTRPRQLTAP